MTASKKDDSDNYMTIEDPEERSVSVVLSSDVICNPETVKLNDQIQYQWNNKKYSGILRFVHENKDLCVKKANSLTNERKTQDKAMAKAAKGGSFDASKQRQAKMNWKERIQETFKKPNKKAEDDKNEKQSTNKNQSRDAILAKRLSNATSDKCEDSDNSDNEPLLPAKVPRNKKPSKISSVSESDDSPKSGNNDSDNDEAKELVEVKKLAESLAKSYSLEQLRKRSKNKDTFPAISIDSIAGPSSQGIDGYPLGNGSGVASTLSKTKFQSNVNEVNGASYSRDISATPTTDNHGEKEENKAMRSKKGGFFKPKPYLSEMFRITNPNEGLELREGCGIFCCPKKFKVASDSGNTGSAVRNLMEGVFTDGEGRLEGCSLTGLPARGKGRDFYLKTPHEIKPFIDPKAIKEIIDLAISWQSKGHWKPKRDTNWLRSQAVAVKLCERRAQKESDSESEQ